MIEAQDLTKVYGGKAAVDHLSFTVEPGRVTGFPAARLCTDLSARCGIKPASPPVSPACPR
jgi:hypothetical protein